jgi:hypothetical protein
MYIRRRSHHELDLAREGFATIDDWHREVRMNPPVTQIRGRFRHQNIDFFLSPPQASYQ